MALPKQGIWLCSVVVLFFCFSRSESMEQYGASYSPQPHSSYAPAPYAPAPYAPAPYAPQQQYYDKPQYHETFDTKVDYREANSSRQCGILPAVHRNEYGYEKDRLAFGEYPWYVNVLDNYHVYLAAGAIISPKHILTSYKAIQGKSESGLVVRIGDYDLQSDHNYLETYKNYEIAVKQVHEYHFVPKSSGYGSYDYEQQDYSQHSYDVAILELYEDIDFDLYPQAEPVCLPEYYKRSKTYYNEKKYSAYGNEGYGYGGAQAQQMGAHEGSAQGLRTQIGVNADLECFVAGWTESPLEKISFEQEKEAAPQYGSGGGYGYSPKPATYYEYYEQSRTPRKAKVSKVYEYDSYGSPAYGSASSSSGYGSYGKSYKTENWIAEYYFDACHADEGAPVFCLVPAKYEQDYEKHYSAPAYQPEYKSAYQPEYKPAYQPEYSQPEYKSGYQAEYKPSYDAPAQSGYQARYKRGANYYQPQPAYQKPAYQKPAYHPQPSYDMPAYQAAPAYQSPSNYGKSSYPSYQPLSYKFPAAPAEYHVDDYRRAVVVGVVSRGTDCTYSAHTETKKIAVTPVKDILDWILSVVQPKSY